MLELPALWQGSPNLLNAEKETYRKAVAVTAWRPGLKNTPYLFTLNLACPEEKWDTMGPLYAHAADSFRLVAPAKACTAKHS